MSKNNAIWKVLLALVIVVVLVIGGIVIFRLGYVRGTASNFQLPEGSDWSKTPFGMTPFGSPHGMRPGIRSPFFGFFPALLCFGGLMFFLVMFGLRGYGRRWTWRNHPTPYGDPWGPPPPSGVKTPSESPPAGKGEPES